MYSQHLFQVIVQHLLIFRVSYYKEYILSGAGTRFLLNEHKHNIQCTSVFRDKYLALFICYKVKTSQA